MWPRFIFLTDYTALERSTVSESVQSRQTGVPSARLLYVFSHKRVRSLNQSLKLDRCCYFCWCSAVGSVHEACLCDRPSYSLAKVRSFMSQQAFPKLIFPPAGHWGITVVIISVPLVSVCNTIKDQKKKDFLYRFAALLNCSCGACVLHWCCQEAIWYSTPSPLQPITLLNNAGSGDWDCESHFQTLYCPSKGSVWDGLTLLVYRIQSRISVRLCAYFCTFHLFFGWMPMDTECHF